MAILGYWGAALTNIFWKSREQYHSGLSKNIFGIFFLSAGILILLAVLLVITAA
jgi:hypothetical protein